MPGYNGPAYQNMISRQSPDELRAQLRRELAQCGGNDSDAWIEGECETSLFDQKQYGWKTRYRLRFASYAGWKAYMLHTGVYAIDPTYERSTD